MSEKENHFPWAEATLSGSAIAIALILIFAPQVSHAAQQLDEQSPGGDAVDVEVGTDGGFELYVDIDPIRMGAGTYIIPNMYGDGWARTGVDFFWGEQGLWCGIDIDYTPEEGITSQLDPFCVAGNAAPPEDRGE